MRVVRWRVCGVGMVLFTIVRVGSIVVIGRTTRCMERGRSTTLMEG